ncbi:MAG: bifunctional phosphoribosylaminoimidazolecarboxamide formyltransferase/IMP cyclohydrolase [Ignavibacteria bacterium]|nr:bifunctional phosphoribosylaminoimidazolecarboxamide formyltransferase/IMP cyclohydrolase [Ignavibacteria bacterium]
MHPESHIIKTALISVSDKTGIVDLAKSLHALCIQLISTGGTASLLKEAGLPVMKVNDITGFPEIMDGRVKTLHPKIHGGLLARLNNQKHVEAMQEHGINSIDLAIVNLYPFEKTISQKGIDPETCIENIDIGGPAMVRASAKNFEWTAIVVHPKNYHGLLEQLQHNGCINLAFRKQLAGEAFAHTAYYDAMISRWFAEQQGIAFPDMLNLSFAKDQSLRYGENPHQHAALYGSFSSIFTQLHGKELSYNNIMDIDAASRIALEFDDPVTVIVKHNNPCGVGIGETLSEAYHKAFATDTVSPFGGILAFNREIDLPTAETIHALFAEVLIAPSFSDEALALLTKKKDRRLLLCNNDALKEAINGNHIRSVAGGLLIQNEDAQLLNNDAVRIVTDRHPTEEESKAMYFAWRIAKHVKSNAIVYASSDRTLAIGAGQMSRLDSARIAVKKAQDVGIDLKGCAVASDAFFPFADGMLQAVEAGATAVIQPGGSVRDAEVISAANEHQVTMMLTGMRHFRH